MRSQGPQHSVPPCQKSIESLCEIQRRGKMGKRIQYTGTTEEKQPFCAFCADFETKRYVYPLSFASLSRFPFLSLRDIFPPAGGSRPSRGTPLRCARNFAATAISRPLGEGGIAAGDDGRGDSRASNFVLQPKTVPPSQKKLPLSGELASRSDA